MREADVESRVADILRHVSGDPGLPVEAGMALLSIPGWDSISLVTTMLLIEDEFGIEFRTNEFAALNTVKDVTRLVETMHG